GMNYENVTKWGLMNSVAWSHRVAMTRSGYNRVAGVVGASQGGSVIKDILRDNQQDLNVETATAVYVEPAHGVRRRVLPVARQLIQFAREGMVFEEHRKAESIDVI